MYSKRDLLDIISILDGDWIIDQEHLMKEDDPLEYTKELHEVEQGLEYLMDSEITPDDFEILESYCKQFNPSYISDKDSLISFPCAREADYDKRVKAIEHIIESNYHRYIIEKI